MRKSAMLALQVMTAQTAEASTDRDLLQRSIAHEEKTIRALADLEAEELRIARVEYEDRESRAKVLFEHLREQSREKIKLCEEHLRRIEGDALDERAQAAETKRLADLVANPPHNKGRTAAEVAKDFETDTSGGWPAAGADGKVVGIHS